MEPMHQWKTDVPLYINSTDDRFNEYVEQLKTMGFSDTETWSLRSVIAEFILPRLKRFKEVHKGYPGTLTEDSWIEILDKMILAFEIVLNADESSVYETGEYLSNLAKLDEGMKLFSKYFMHLWW
jgi:hypothetical protein